MFFLNAATILLAIEEIPSFHGNFRVVPDSSDQLRHGCRLGSDLRYHGGHIMSLNLEKFLTTVKKRFSLQQIFFKQKYKQNYIQIQKSSPFIIRKAISIYELIGRIIGNVRKWWTAKEKVWGLLYKRAENEWNST